MIDPHIQSRGFRNIRNNEQLTGFSLSVLSPYYRGVYLSLIEGFVVSVDGCFYQGDAIRCVFNGDIYNFDELGRASQARWQWSDPAVLLVSKPGGLAPGMHDVQVTTKIRISYMPTKPTSFPLTATIPLVV